MAAEARDTRLKRMKMRSMRRGTKEMDLLMMRFAEAHLDTLTDSELETYDQLLSENDQDLYQWVTGQVTPPEPLGDIVRRIADTAAADPISKRPV